ncbi:MAG: Exopolyphosphatase [Planctomycetota bacterium]|jgi:exopolyphosphatase/guanosine-5'-triphosphate,3'-diphosphate pyrophosphatase
MSSGSASSGRTEEKKTIPVAVIDIGATSIRMAIAEIEPSGKIRLLETLNQAVSLGKDTFSQRRIRKSSIEDCVRVLRSYKKLLQEYGISHPSQMRIVATSAVREAMNRLAFLDRIYVATGLNVEPIEEAEVNRITYMGIQPLLQADSKLAASRTVIVEVGGGSTEVLVVRGGNVLFSNTYRLGSLRLLETLERFNAPKTKQLAIMESQIRRVVDQICEQVQVDTPVEMIALGGDVRFAVANLLEEWDQETLAVLSTEQLEVFTKRVISLSEDEVVQRFGVSFQDAETVGSALLSYVLLARGFGVETMRVADVNLRDGLLQDLATKDLWTADFRNQIIRSAIGLGRKYHFDEKHARHVGLLARKLFTDLQSEHRLDSRMELILYLAALLHEIGLYLNVRSNHKHAFYLIRNSELFGLSRREVLLVALVARYHRRSSPQPDHEGYATLDRDDRVAVAKMAAILRLAIALEESRNQRITEMKCKADSSRMVITVRGVEDISLEQLAMRQNCGMFEEVYGSQVVLRTSRK